MELNLFAGQLCSCQVPATDLGKERTLGPKKKKKKKVLFVFTSEAGIMPVNPMYFPMAPGMGL